MIIIGGISVLFIYMTRLASKEIFSPSNKIHREVGRAKDLSAPQVILYSYPDDDHRKSGRNMLVINNITLRLLVWLHNFIYSCNARVWNWLKCGYDFCCQICDGCAFQTFAIFWLLYSYFRVISRRLNFMCRRFGTPCSIFIGGILKPSMKTEQTVSLETSAYKIQTPGIRNRQSVPKRRRIKFGLQGIIQKWEYVLNAGQFPLLEWGKKRNLKK
jgi:hypothetical protein